MDEERKKRVSVWGVFLMYGALSSAIVLLLVPLCIVGLYVWAHSLGTCVNRPAFTLLSMLEELLPWLTRPIQALVCKT